jgi:hypothetical protein
VEVSTWRWPEGGGLYAFLFLGCSGSDDGGAVRLASPSVSGESERAKTWTA